MIIRLLCYFLSFLFFDLFMLGVGYLLFYIGEFFYFRFLVRLGHIIVAYSSAKERSRTFRGVASAMADQWS